eukprot:6176851-Pleurochrysis_carterae.AAC.2
MIERQQDSLARVYTSYKGLNERAQMRQAAAQSPLLHQRTRSSKRIAEIPMRTSTSTKVIATSTQLSSFSERLHRREGIDLCSDSLVNRAGGARAGWQVTAQLARRQARLIRCQVRRLLIGAELHGGARDLALNLCLCPPAYPNARCSVRGGTFVAACAIDHAGVICSAGPSLNADASLRLALPPAAQLITRLTMSPQVPRVQSAVCSHSLEMRNQRVNRLVICNVDECVRWQHGRIVRDRRLVASPTCHALRGCKDDGHRANRKRPPQLLRHVILAV